MKEPAMRKYEISPALIAQMRKRAVAVQFREVGVPLYLPAHHTDAGLPARAYVEFDAVDLRVDAGGITIGGDEDDDFY
jgi:hypothetical protein